MSVLRARQWALAAALTHVDPYVVALPKPAAPTRKRTRQSLRKGSTRYWRDLIHLMMPGEEGREGSSVPVLLMNYAQPIGRVTGNSNLGVGHRIAATGWNKLRNGDMGATLHRNASQSFVINSTNSPYGKSLNFYAAGADHIVNTHGITMVQWGACEGTTHRTSVSQDGGFNSANGYSCSVQMNQAATTAAQNGTASRGAGDVATCLTAAVTPLAVGESFIGYHHISKTGNLEAAMRVWDAAGQRWHHQAQIDGSMGVPDTFSLAGNFGDITRIGGIAIWRGCPITWRDFLRDMAHRKNPAELFYG